jgi:hypothetical protein
VVEDLLTTWQAGAAVEAGGVRVIGRRFSKDSHDLRDFLVRTRVPAHWLDVAGSGLRGWIRSREHRPSSPRMVRKTMKARGPGRYRSRSSKSSLRWRSESSPIVLPCEMRQWLRNFVAFTFPYIDTVSAHFTLGGEHVGKAPTPPF